MVVAGILGFQGVVYAVLLLGFVLIRQAWRNAEAKKEEIARLVEDAAIADMVAASIDYYSSSTTTTATSIPVPVSVPNSRWHQCVVCYAPTTMRCAQCKSVRYCSGKCQIIHWRHGHKDECCPPVATVQLNEEPVSHRAAVSDSESETHSGIHGNDLIGRCNMLFCASCMVYNLVRFFAEMKGTHAGIASARHSYSGANPSVSARESFDGASRIRLAKPVGNSTTEDTCVSSSHTNESVSTPTLPVESKDSVNTEVKDSGSSKRSKTNSSNSAGENVSKSKPSKTRSDVYRDVVSNSSGHEHRRRVATIEKSVADTKCRNVSSLNSCSTDFVADHDLVEESHLSKHKEARKSSSSSADLLSSTTKGDLASHSKSSKSDNYHTLPAKSAIPNLPLNVRNGLKTSMQKVVQQFRGSKESRSDLVSVENEVAFPYELFSELYCYDKVKLFPFGLTNCGNSLLNCYTISLGQKKGWCFICEFEYLIQKAKEGNSPLSPIGILSKIHKIGSHFGHGREEDAHEFLRCAVDTMQAICLKEAGISSPLAEETTLIGYTFGGYLRSKIKCLRCLGKSERYERMMDLTVEIDGDIGTLEDALRQFTAPEILDKDNKYNCSRCKSYEKAKKKLTVLEAPNILTIVLKRFQSGNFEKLNKSVQFPEVLNMTPYMSGTKDKSPLYSLYAVVVHLDTMNTAFSGHYICYVKNIQGEWFRTNDSKVEPVELSRVLAERAYMLLYARHSPKPRGLVSSTTISPKFKRRNLEAIPSTSKTRSSTTAPSADSSSLQQKHGKHPSWSVLDDSLSNDFAYPEEWRFHYGMDSSSESSSLFSSSDASSCSTSSIKDSASSADFSDYIFGEVGSNWYNNQGLSSNSYDNLSTEFLVDSDANRRHRQDSELENKAVLYANKNRNHSGSRVFDLKRFVTINHRDKSSSTHVKRTSRDASAQTFYRV
ncbi:hypothetical protein Ahy_Scaffold1g107510 isoform D [Arachis hypogaea]|uniref:Ubiquitin carboxyl-terminal hydrolase n=1 Tax=Arachis hypogaea TaxID=3818 RepID=A0A444WVY6_ARAHY|nr:hypothetical protein Ahy_Scaffold1g107510 isoform D [Arachis hypogaea]